MCGPRGAPPTQCHFSHRGKNCAAKFIIGSSNVLAGTIKMLLVRKLLDGQELLTGEFKTTRNCPQKLALLVAGLMERFLIFLGSGSQFLKKLKCFAERNFNKNIQDSYPERKCGWRNTVVQSPRTHNAEPWQDGSLQTSPRCLSFLRSTRIRLTLKKVF